MIEFFRKLLETDFMPHGHCYFWTPEILWPIAVSNAIIALAYFAIPAALIYIYNKRGDFKYVWMAMIFAIFIFGCALTHVFDIINIWQPYYRLDAVVRVATAVASIGAAVVLAKVTPQIIKMPTLEQWKEVNDELRVQIQQLKEKDMVIEAIRKFEELADAVPQIMWICNADGQMTYINNKWFEFSGNPEIDLSDTSLPMDYWKEYIHPDDYKPSIDQWEKALLSRENYEYEIRMKDKNGGYQWFLSRGVPVKGSLDNRWFGTFTNINEQKKQNEELRKINSDLDNFVYAASHDLRAPITNMMGILSLLNDEKRKTPLPKEKEKKFLEMLGKSVDKLNIVIDDLTEISKLQKNIANHQENLYMPDVVAELESELQEQIQKTSTVIKTDFQVKGIHFSRKNMRSILYNMITNSIKYKSPERDPEIIIKTFSSNNYFILEVRDNGIGFEDKYKYQIFDLFKRLHNDDRGTGVGLFIVKRIVDNAEGKIEVHSDLGAGTSFKIYLKI
jgi:PAS domain S-box-containing protein